MTYKELKDQLDKEEALYEKKREEFKEFEEAHDRIIEDIYDRMKEASEKFVKTVKKHFAGVEVLVLHSPSGLTVGIYGVRVLEYYDGHINSKLSESITNKIIAEYKEYYGKE